LFALAAPSSAFAPAFDQVTMASSHSRTNSRTHQRTTSGPAPYIAVEDVTPLTNAEEHQTLASDPEFDRKLINTATIGEKQWY